MEKNSKPCSGKQGDFESESKDIVNFDKSLQELRDLRSQLHYAADYCESTFLASTEKRAVVENTKEYICRAVITVVDHLGCVSDNLNDLISESNEFSDAELRINCLKQRILLCEQFSHKFALTRVRWCETLPRHSARFLATPTGKDEKPNEDLRVNSGYLAFQKSIDKHEFERDEAMPLFMYTHKRSLSKEDLSNSALVPVRDGLSILSRRSSPAFHFQETRKNYGRNIKKSVQGGDIFSVIRRVKRAM